MPINPKITIRETILLSGEFAIEITTEAEDGEQVIILSQEAAAHLRAELGAALARIRFTDTKQANWR